jgi:hypothetical protein
LGDKLEVASDMDTYSRRLPLGVTAAITPFNFPAMIVLWSAALATVTGELGELADMNREELEGVLESNAARLRSSGLISRGERGRSGTSELR